MCSDGSEIVLVFSCPLEMTLAPPPHNCGGDGRGEGDESGKGAGRLPSCYDD